jgi:hypothetical protein
VLACTTALHPQADLHTPLRRVGLVPQAAVSGCAATGAAAGTLNLIDNFVGARQHDWRQVETDRLRGLEIYYQLELGRLLYRQVGRFGTIEDSDDVPGGEAKQVGEVGAIGQQPPELDELAGLVHGREPMRGCGLDDQASLRGRQERAAAHDGCLAS